MGASLRVAFGHWASRPWAAFPSYHDPFLELVVGPAFAYCPENAAATASDMQQAFVAQTCLVAVVDLLVVAEAAVAGHAVLAAAVAVVVVVAAAAVLASAAVASGNTCEEVFAPCPVASEPFVEESAGHQP